MRLVFRNTLAVGAALALLTGVLGAAGASPAIAATPVSTPSPSTGNGDPSLAEMDATGNHTLGSTIRQYDPSAATAPSTRSLSALSGNIPAGTQGLDVSGWQVLNPANWAQIYANGGRFVYVKATEGTTYTSSQFSEQYTDSYVAGLTHGAYHFATPNTSSGAAQANFFVSNGGGWSADGRTLPPLLDIEYNPYGATCYGLGQSAMVAWIRDFSNTVLARTGRLPAIYSTTGWWTACTGNSGAFGANPLFIARYPNSISEGAGALPAGWSSYSMWQYADSGVFPGDQDVFNGSAAALQAFALGTPPVVTPPPPIVTPLDSPVIGVGDFNGDGKPDFIARRPDGTLWFYAGTGTVNSANHGYLPAVEIGNGWNIYDSIVGVGDFNGDGKPDLIARRPDGTLWFYAGTGVVSATSNGYLPAVLIGNGWNQYSELIASGDFNGDGKPDLLAVKPDGTLWFYAGTGLASSTSNGYLAALQIGNGGWNGYKQVLGIGDLDRDGHPDLIGMRTDGSLWFYAGTGQTTGADAYYRPAQELSTSAVTSTETLTAPGDLDGDGYPDLLARTTSGALQFIGGKPLYQSGYSPALKIGTAGWTGYSHVVGVGDFNGDGKPDIIAVRPDGTLWFYAGTGTAGASGAGTAGSSEGYLPAQKIGTSGWNAYTKIIGVGDFNGDGKPDLIAVRNDGSLWFYAGTGVVNSGSNGYLTAKKIGTSGWLAYSTLLAGDFTGDGKPDLIGIRPDGTTWLYAGTQKTTGTDAFYAPATPVAGAGWNSYAQIVSAGDLNQDGKPDLIATKANGSLSLLAGNGSPTASSTGFAAPVVIGSNGWTEYSSLVGTYDLNGDKLPDFVGIRPDGTLWFYAGTGVSGDQVPALNAPLQIGAGWNVYE